MNASFVGLVVAAVAVSALVWWFRRMRSNDVFDALMHRRKGTARISSRAELVDGANHIPVALTLEPQRIVYESSDMQADLDIAAIDEVEYGSELITGQRSAGPVLRLRAHGRSIEFVLEHAAAQSWSALLPAHRVDQVGHVHAN